MSEAYKAFARVYDAMQYDVDYEFWVQKIDEKINAYLPNGRSILELACGTGTISIGLSKMGYYVEGLDLSEEMLTIASSKSKHEKQRIVFYHQDMKDFQLNRTYDAIVCMCDGLNYTLDHLELEAVFNKAHAHLNEEGLFLFDLSSRYKLEKIVGNETFAETFEDAAYIWENEYDSENKVLSFWLTLFVEEHNGIQRYEEYHKQRAYEIDEIKQVVLKNFDVLELLDGDHFDALKETSQRLCFVCKKK